MTRCEGAPNFPEWTESSSRYRDVFNATADDMGVPIKYVADRSGASCTNNIPDPACDEVVIVQEKAQRYMTDGRVDATRFAADICAVRTEVERRRHVMVQKGMEVFPVSKSSTYTEDKLRLLNPAERAWAAKVAPVFSEVSLAVYGVQATRQSGPTTEWMNDHADPYSAFHYHRSRHSGLPTQPVEDFKNSEHYSSSIPWFPANSSFNMMWPVDLTADELADINQHYTADDPIRLPFTRVYRVPPALAERIAANPMHHAGNQIEWVREGKSGESYRVLNMAFDPEIRPSLLQLTATLRQEADVTVQGSALHPTFREYTLTVADALERGDFVGLLRADLQQAEGGLFMTLFPHEGYWEDGVKYPMMGEIGIRDVELIDRAAKFGHVFQWMGQEIQAVARAAGFSTYVAPQFDASNVRRDMAFIWPVVTGGFMRAYVRDPGGHDYPKRRYDGLNTHRVVMVLDTLKTWAPLCKQTAARIFGPDVAQHVNFDAKIVDTLFHEAGHGAQIPQDETLPTGKPFGEAFGIHWGILVEPWADADAMLALHKLWKDGVVSEDHFKQGLYASLSYQFVRLRPRAVALSDGVMAGGPHITGSSEMIGWLWARGAFTRDASGAYHLAEVPQLVDAVRGFRNTLVGFAARGDVAGFKQFVTKTVTELPEVVEKDLIARRGAASYTLIDRGDLKPVPDGSTPTSVR